MIFYIFSLSSSDIICEFFCGLAQFAQHCEVYLNLGRLCAQLTQSFLLRFSLLRTLLLTTGTAEGAYTAEGVHTTEEYSAEGLLRGYKDSHVGIYGLEEYGVGLQESTSE